jgi:hypothetical protein
MTLVAIYARCYPALRSRTPAFGRVAPLWIILGEGAGPSGPDAQGAVAPRSSGRV